MSRDGVVWGQGVPGPAQHRSGPWWWPRGAVPACCGLGDCPWPWGLSLAGPRSRSRRISPARPPAPAASAAPQRSLASRDGYGEPGRGGDLGWAAPLRHPLHLQENRSPSGSHRDAFTDTPWPDDPPGTPPGSPAPPGRGGRRGAGRPLGVLMTPTFPQATARLTPSAPRSKSSWSSPPITR